MNIYKDLEDKWLILPIVILVISLLLRIYWTFINLREYPFEHIPDAKNHMVFLFFLAKYGFHQIVPNWWNGFVLFDNYTPGWHFASLPLYYLTKDLVYATFLSLIQSLSLGLIFILVLGRFMKISVLKSVFLFLLFFASPMLMDYMQIGRYPELFGWVLFIPFFFIVQKYKERSIDKKFLVFIPLYAAIILSHMYTFISASILIFALFLVKKVSERVIICLSVVLSFLMTSFWWPSVFKFMIGNSSLYKGSFELLSNGSLISYNTIILTCFLIVFYFYYKSCKNKKKDFLFYSPLLTLSILLLTRGIVLVPMLNSLPVMFYNIFFYIIIIYLFFNTSFNFFQKIFKYWLPVTLVLITILFSIFSFIQVTYSKPEHTVLKDDLFSIVPEIEGRYLIVTTDVYDASILPHAKPEILDSKIIAYSVIKYNLSSPIGILHPGGIVPKHMESLFKQIYGCSGSFGDCLKEIKTMDCNTLNTLVKEQNIKSLITADKDCSILRDCGFGEKLKKKRACLFVAS